MPSFFNNFPCSKLLSHLDAAVQQEPQAMEQAVVDKAYMAQLVEVQQMRGASGGKEFHKLLTQEEVKEEPKVKGQCYAFFFDHSLGFFV